jgi:hypothetical protein
MGSVVKKKKKENEKTHAQASIKAHASPAPLEEIKGAL